MLPSGYLQVKYIENPNKGYIKTDIVPENSNCGFEIKFKLNDVSKENVVFGHNFNNQSDSPKLYIYYRYSDTNTVLYQTRKLDDTTYTESLKSILDITDTEHAHIVRVPMIDYINTWGTKSNEVYVDGKLKTIIDDYSILPIDSTHQSVYRFFSLYDSTDSSKGDSKIYWVKTYDVNNKVNHEFIPCIRISDNIAGFYETYTGKFFSSSNSNQLVAGPVVNLPKEYTMVEYIKNTGSEAQQCAIDTGMKFSLLNHSFEVKFKLDEISNGMILGTRNNDAGDVWVYNYTNNGSFRFFGCYYEDDWKIKPVCYSPLDIEVHTLKYEGSSTSSVVYLDGVLKGNVNLSNYASEYSTDNLFIFGRGINSNCYNGKIYYVKLWNTSTKLMLLYYIPCIRKSDNKAGFYDVVSHSFKCIERDYWEAGPKLITKGKSIDLIQQRARSQSNILPYTCQVEYLEATGTQYIDTGIKSNHNLSVEIKFNMTPGSGSSVFGYYDPSNIEHLTISVGSNLPQRFGDKFCNATIPFDTDSIIITNKYGFSLNGNTISRSLPTNFSSNYTLYLMWINNALSQYRCSGKFYYCKIWNNDVLVRDFIPVRVGNVGYMYDKVSGQLFGNSGTGNFVLGQDIVPVEYLESTGTQYVDTGFIPNNESGIYAEFYFSSQSGTHIVVGSRESSSGDNRWWINSTSGIEYGWNTWESVSGYTNNDWNDFENNFLNSRKGRVNGVNSRTNYPTLVNFTKSAYLFAANIGGSANYKFTGKIRNIKFSQGDNITIDLIPVRVGTTGYMYDKISNRLFGNSGTGNFLFGEDIKKDYAKRYLTIEPLGSGNITITIPAQIDSTYMTSISYSKDMVNWTDTAIDNTALTITIPVVNGDNVYLKGIGNKMSTNDLHALITSSSNYNLSGNILSLLYGDNFVDKVLSSENSRAFYALFLNSTTLVNAKNLMLLSTSLLTYCYHSMFYGCSNLISAPVLPATTLATSCYYNMFRDCTSLIKAPELPATILTSNCYRGMFYGCTSLTTAPELPATTLTNYCYRAMFNGCTNLNYIKMLATDISATDCLTTWLKDVSPTGTFIRNSEMTTLPSGASGIPEGWIVQTSNN